MSITDSNNLRSTNYSIANLSDANRLGQDVTFNIEQLRSLGLGNGDSQGLINTVTNTVYGNSKELQGIKFDLKNYTNQFRSIRNFESTETYTSEAGTNTANTTVGQFITGAQSIKGLNAGSTGNGAIRFFSNTTVNLTLFADGVTSSLAADKIVLSFFINNTANFTTGTGGAVLIWFYTNAASKTTARARYGIPLASLVNGWNVMSVNKNEFTYETFTDASWANVVGFYVYASTASTSAEISFDNLFMISNVGSFYDVIATSGSSNSDISTGTTLTVTDGRRLNNLLLTSPYKTYLVSNANATNGYGKSSLIASQSSGVITASNTLPTITNDVSWDIEIPYLDVKVGNFIYALEETATMFKIATVTDTTQSAKIALINTFKPTNPNANFYLKSHFQFRANSKKQGFCLYYIDSSNYLLAYISNLGASSVLVLDQVIAGNTTNIYTSGTFTIVSNDDLILAVQVNGDNIKLYRSDVNSSLINFIRSVNYYNPAFIDYKYQVGIYSDLEIRVLELEAREDNNITDNRLSSVSSGTFATASTLTITNSSIHKTSMITFQLRSAPVGNIFISSINEGTVIFTSSSASETAQIRIQVYN